MAKIFLKAPQIEAVYKKLMGKITGKIPLADNESIIKLWRFGDKPAHAGQLLGRKVLPNGKTQMRITTVWAGEGHQISTDTRVYNSAHKLTNLYHGNRGAAVKLTDANGVVQRSINETRAYGSTPRDVAKIIQMEVKMNPTTQYFPSLG